MSYTRTSDCAMYIDVENSLDKDIILYIPIR